MKDAFAILRADKQLQGSIHDLALGLQAREFFRLADQGFVNVDVSASHKLIIHQFYQAWCIGANFATEYDLLSRLLPSANGNLTLALFGMT